LAACRALRPLTLPPPLSEAAAVAFEEARQWTRAQGQIDPAEAATSVRGAAALTASQRALAACQRALELEPGWVAPWRLRDEILRAELRGLEALEEHWTALERDPQDAGRHYLAGRLEGSAALPRFERAAELDPGLSWAWHGLAFCAGNTGQLGRAIRHQRRALSLARGSAERSTFTAALARYLVADERPREALELLRRRLADADLASSDALELAVQTARVELSLLFRPEAREGQRRALELLRERDLTDAEVETLFAELRLQRSPDGAGTLELELALAARPGRARDRLRAELLLDQRPTALALGLLRRSREAQGLDPRAGGPLLRAARFAASDFAGAVEDWVADLPRVVLEAGALPKDERLAAIVRRARSLGGSPGPAQLVAFGEELLSAGWYREARSVAAAVAETDLDAALSLDDRAAAGQELIGSLRRLLYGLDERGSAEARARAPRTLSGVLSAMSPSVARAARELGGELDPQQVQAQLLSSPRIHYGPVAQIVHPGPWFGPEDERAGRGQRGQVVPGLASLLERLGRFAILGQVAGGDPPDAVLLQRVLVEFERGEHLGTRWHGTLAWCDGTDVRSRAGRLGASISGAALHEGFWIDIDAVRRERDDWARLEREFFARDDGRVERALATRGLPLARGAGLIALERVEAGILLGQADRVRLAVLRDRRIERGVLARGLVDLDELVALTAIHEQGHLCDRARFLPIQRHLGRVLRLLATVGFSPTAIAARLEYRAELVALCQASDPRVVLANILRSPEQGEGALTPHARAYAQLLRDLLGILEEELQVRPQSLPELSGERLLAHQLHHLKPEQVRALARRLARREGLGD
jgi:Tfp pilus assembly protein PilF